MSLSKINGLALALVALGAGSVAAQSVAPSLPAPSHFAIRNARIVTAPGRAIARGTIVIKDGLITAVGANVAAPAGAWVIDGAGLTVYPGLVDALSTVGLPAALRLPEPRAGGAAGAGTAASTAQPPYSWGPQDRPATASWLSAADQLSVGDERVATWRNAGFTSAVVTPERGFFPGQAAFVNLAGERANDMVVRTPVALRVNLQGGPDHRGYPNSLMGAIAYIKQVFFDAQQYDQAWTIYQATPVGLARPEYDRALEPLRDALKTRRPVLLPANLAKEVERALALARETGAVPVVYGLQEGYRIPTVVARSGAPVLVNVDWPVRDRDADPDADVALATLRFRDRAPTTPGELERAGVRFAFYSGRITDPRDMLANVRKAIALGLTADGALRALTVAPAEIFGVADRVGTLDVGKIANLVVTEGELFDARPRVKYVFVDGRKFEPVAAEAQTAGVGGGEARGGRRAADTTPPSPPVPMVKDRGPVRTARTTLIRNATILTVANGTVQNGSILIRDGKIAAVGTNVTAPADAQVIDASGKYVMPGIIDAHSHIATDAVNEGSVSVSAMVGIQDVLNPDDVAIYEAAAGGVTSANILHGSANPIGGRNAVIKTRWGADAAGLLLQGAPPGIKFALGENTKRDREPDRYPFTRMGVQDVIREAFLEAREYQRQWREYEAARRARRAAISPRRDLKLETLAEILDGKRLVHAHSYRADEILQLIRLADEFGFKIATFQHVLEGYQVADEMARHGAGGSTFSDWWAYKVEAYEAIPYNAALMTERGVVASINSDSREEMRHLNQEAAKAMKWGGLSETDALKLVTLNPARQLGVADRVGSIEVGKDADLVIYTNHPLSVYSIVDQTLVDGQVYFDRQADLARRRALEEEKRALLDKERGATPERPRVTTTAETPREDQP
ncbi:MAG TPA: amidohydrolase family protein [Gemmatimonadales bacterium]|jgi:imidazolonepropionase-like amidohydrolase|nr:amidohydrolase family protein [Gemmatimonadales bacterium]